MEIRTEDPKLGVVPPSDSVIILKEKDGKRLLLISLNLIYLHLFGWQIENVKTPYPRIFEFVLEFANSLKASIEKVVIYDLRDDDVFQSRVVIKDDRENRTYNINLSASDAITLAVAVKCPIFIEEEVFEKSAQHQERYQQRTSDEEIQRIFENMDLDKLPKN